MVNTRERNYETPEILSDSPLTEINDTFHFHFDEYAATFARLIACKTTRTPLTIGVSGAWGSGKTTLLRRVQHKLDQTLSLLKQSEPATIDFVYPRESPQELFRVCRTVWFNAWKYADEDALLVALVRVIVQKMFSDDLIAQSAAAIFNPFKDRRDVINTVLGWFKIKTPFGEIELDTGEPQQTPFAEKTAILDLFDDVFDRLMAIWVHHSLSVNKINPERGVLVVFIDDLDRCLPEKTVQVLEAIKLFLDKPGCVFILGADAEVVRQAVESHYQNASVTGQNAADYLEKVIQLRFDLPPVPDQAMQQFLQEQQVTDDMLAEWRTLLAAAQVNPRRVKAVLNDIELQWRILVNSGQAEGVQRADFIRWSALMRAAPTSFKERIFDIDDIDLRFKFIQDALRWGGGDGDETLARTFQEYERQGRRLRRVLREIRAFSEGFDAPTLNAFIYLSAPPARTISMPAVEQVGVSEEIGVRISTPEAVGVTGQTWGGIEFVRVPAGKFLMGSKNDNDLALEAEKPQHAVDLRQEFWIGKYPVTNAQFAEFVKAKDYRTAADIKGAGMVFDGKDWRETPGANWQHPRGPQSSLEGRENHPTVMISWQDAQEYCRWLNQTFAGEITESWQFRLPTEAEWEKAARGEYGNEWPWGSEQPDSSRCNFNNNEGDTTLVGKYSPHGDSPYSAADMASNVWEWCSDWFGADEYKNRAGKEVNNPQGPKDGQMRVLRGGSWSYDRSLARCAYRSRGGPGGFDNGVGFRVVLSPNFPPGQ